MREYIAKSSSDAKKNTREKLIYGDKLVFLKDQLPYNFDLQYVLDTVEGLIPIGLIDNIDAIYVGQFKDLDNGSMPFNAKYKDGAIYITNEQDSENDMIDDLVHEIAHAVEEKYGEILYSDGNVESEFLNKRKALYTLLEQEGYEPSLKKFNNMEYNKYFDHYLYNVVGYPLLESLVIGLFYSPYSITSINEYFANGFENYFLRDKDYLKNISPVLYDKINDILDNLDD